VHHGYVSVDVKNVGLISLRQRYNCKESEGGTIKQMDVNFCRICSSLLASVDVTEFQNAEIYSNLDLTNVKYSTYEHYREENLKVMERIRPKSFMNSKNMKSK
jgi:hypothetical protein